MSELRLWFDVQALQGPFFERGIQRYVRAVATELERRGSPVEAFGTNPSQRAPYAEHGAVATSSLLRPATAAALRAAAADPGLVYLSGSAFEGFTPIQNLWPNATVIPEVPVAAIVYDTIPFRRPDDFQATHERRSFYGARRALLRQADRFLCISNSTARELAEDLELEPRTITEIGCGVDERFTPADDPDAVAAELREALPDIRFPYLLYVGGFQPQKNVEGLLEAHARLEPELRRSHQLVVGGNVPTALRAQWEARIEALGLDGAVLFTGLVSDDLLLALYRGTRLMVFPSLHEGFGLPVAEAAACGAPAIASNTSSLPEVIGWEPSTFDPADPEAIAATITRVLTDTEFDAELRRRCAESVSRHRWTTVVDRLLAECAPLAGPPRRPSTPHRRAVVGGSIADNLAAAPPQPGWVTDHFAETGSVRAEVVVAPLRSFGRTAEPALYDEIIRLDSSVGAVDAAR